MRKHLASTHPYNLDVGNPKPIKNLQRFFASKITYPWFPSSGPTVLPSEESAITAEDISALRTAGHIVGAKVFGDLPISYLPNFQLYRCNSCSLPIHNIRKHFYSTGIMEIDTPQPTIPSLPHIRNTQNLKMPTPSYLTLHPNDLIQTTFQAYSLRTDIAVHHAHVVQRMK
jgi:hypothetical protein